MSSESVSNDQLITLLREAVVYLEWSADFAEGGPGAEEPVKDMLRLVGAIHFALGEDLGLTAPTYYDPTEE